MRALVDVILRARNTSFGGAGCIVALLVACTSAAPKRNATAARPPTPSASASASASVVGKIDVSLDAPACDADPSRPFTTTISDDERWILQDDGRNVRVWRRDDAGVTLALRGTLRFATFAPDDRLFALDRVDDRRLVVIDLATRAARTFDRALAYGVVGAHLYVADETSVRRYAWPSLQPEGEVTSATPWQPSASAFREIGAAFVVGDALVDFHRAPPAVLARGLRFFAASKNGERVVACADIGQPRVVSTTSGDTLFSIDATKTAVCNWSFPGLSPDGRFVVAVDEAPVSEGRRMATMTWDVATKAAKRRVDPKTSFSTALDAEVEVEDTTPPRICVDFGNMHWRDRQCPWVLGASGAVTVAPKTVAKADAESAAWKALAKQLGNLRVAEATSPDGATRVIATAKDEPSDGVDDELDLHVVDEATATLRRSIEVMHEPFQIVLFAHDGESPPTLRFLDATHAFYESHSFPPSRIVLDTVSGAFDTIDPSATSLHGRFVMIDDALVDVISHARLPLTPTATQCKAAQNIEVPPP